MSLPAASTSADSYDAVPYFVAAFRQTDPDHLAVIARIFGLPSAPPQSCRVLELGCAGGGNLVPMAVACPQSHYVGIDLSERQIAEGHAMLRELALPNIELHHLSITDLTPDFGRFDYILAHGVYSWVPPAVQEKILEICRDNLTENGAAYISYNTFPGWHTSATLREIACHHTANISDPGEKIRAARRHLDFLARHYASTKEPLHAVLAEHIAELKTHSDTYFLHEFLESFNEPLYFHQFNSRAAAKGLQFLAESDINLMNPAAFGKETEKELRAMCGTTLELEQSMDFLRLRRFRRTLLCHDHHRLDHAVCVDAPVSFHIASPMKPESAHPDTRSPKPESFTDRHHPRITTTTPLMKAALVLLAAHWPLPIPFAALLEQSREQLGAAHAASLEQDSRDLAEALLNCFHAGSVEFTAAPPRFITHITLRPTTTPYARLRALISEKEHSSADMAAITNLRLENVALPEPARFLLSHLDGAHDKPALIQLLTDFFAKNPPPPQKHPEPPPKFAARFVNYSLSHFAASALLIG